MIWNAGRGRQTMHMKRNWCADEKSNNEKKNCDIIRNGMKWEEKKKRKRKKKEKNDELRSCIDLNWYTRLHIYRCIYIQRSLHTCMQAAKDAKIIVFLYTEYPWVYGWVNKNKTKFIWNILCRCEGSYKNKAYVWSACISIWRDGKTDKE